MVTEMAYIIKVHDCNIPESEIIRAIRGATNEVYVINVLQAEIIEPFRLGPRTGSRKAGAYVVRMERIRLKSKKPYCGNHPGPCVVNPFFVEKKKNARFLEWDDWVSFHAAINDVLDELGVDADVSTKPQDAQGIMWIRKGFMRRNRWDYEEGGIRGTRVWNLGTADQFL